MRLIVLNLIGGLLIMGLLAGCSKPKSMDDGSGPRDLPPNTKSQQQMQQKTKSDKPPMDPSKMPPKPPDPSKR